MSWSGWLYCSEVDRPSASRDRFEWTPSRTRSAEYLWSYETTVGWHLVCFRIRKERSLWSVSEKHNLK
jgi:hypothetical protein